MKTWYFAKCEKCLEVKKIFVSNPSGTAEEIQSWFVYLGDKDDHLDQLWDEGYSNKDLT
jgi:hypothetical protein